MLSGSCNYTIISKITSCWSGNPYNSKIITVSSHLFCNFMNLWFLDAQCLFIYVICILTNPLLSISISTLLKSQLNRTLICFSYDMHFTNCQLSLENFPKTMRNHYNAILWCVTLLCIPLSGNNELMTPTPWQSPSQSVYCCEVLFRKKLSPARN